MTGQLLADRYKIINVLGAGGMGQTYVAEDTQRPNNPKCVVKQLKPVSPDPNFLVTARRLFTGEAEMLDKLGDHDQIPRLFAYFERDGEFYLVQEWIDGQPLSAELPLGQRWTEPQVIALLKDVLVILEFIHGQGVIHRDIKPDNIMRRRQDGKLVLIDFGAVKQVRTQQTTAVGQISMTVAIGTPGYMPTEQSSGKPRPSSDIYALGMVAIQALTGLFPAQFREDEMGEVIWRDQAEVSDGLASVLTKMTKHYFANRYQSASDVLQALKELESPAAYARTEFGENRGYSQTKVEPVVPDYSKHAQTVVEPPNPRPAPVEPDNKNAKPAAGFNYTVYFSVIFAATVTVVGLIYAFSRKQPDPVVVSSPSSTPTNSSPSPQASPSATAPVKQPDSVVVSSPSSTPTNSSPSLQVSPSATAPVANNPLVNQGYKARQSMAKTYVSTFNKAQQAFFIEKNSWATDIPSLQLGTMPQSEDYSFTTEVSFSSSTIQRKGFVVNRGIAKKDGLKSYLGAVYLSAVPATNEITSLAILCESNEPTKDASILPKLNGYDPICPDGYRQL